MAGCPDLEWNPRRVEVLAVNTSTGLSAIQCGLLLRTLKSSANLVSCSTAFLGAQQAAQCQTIWDKKGQAWSQADNRNSVTDAEG